MRPLQIVYLLLVKVKKSATTKPTPVSGKEISEQELSEVENAITADLRALPELNVDAIRNVRRKFSAQLHKNSPAWIIALALRLVSSGVVPRFFAYELIEHHKPALQSLNTASLEALGRGNDSWEKVDTFASYLAGPVWRERQISDNVIQRWARSTDRWWRRTALVSTVPLNNKARGGRGDSERTLMICEMLVDDRDDMVIKALSWALRELSKRDADSVNNFLQKHEEALAPRVIREVQNKLQTGLKNPRIK